MDLAPLIVTLAATLGSGLITFLATFFRRLTRSEAQRVELQAGSDSLRITGATAKQQQQLIKRFLQGTQSDEEDDEIRAELRENLTREEAELGEAVPALDEHTRLVLRYYAQGVGQAQVSFYFSLAFASVGFMVIVAGVVLAILQPTSAVQTAVTVGAGVITDAISALFFTLANRSRSVMTTFIDKLRLDRDREREFLKSLELIEIIESDQLRDSLKSIAALRFLRAESDIRSLPGFPDTARLTATTNGSNPEPAQADREQLSLWLRDAPSAHRA